MKYQTFNISKLRFEFLGKGDDEPQTLAEGNHMIEIEDDVVEDEEASKAMAFNAIVPFIPPFPLLLSR